MQSLRKLLQRLKSLFTKPKQIPKYKKPCTIKRVYTKGNVDTIVCNQCRSRYMVLNFYTMKYCEFCGSEVRKRV